MGKEEAQRSRKYSRFIGGGEWTPMSKGNKAEMQDLVFGDSFPELAAIAESGQRGIVFRARRNEPGGVSGWV